MTTRGEVLEEIKQFVIEKRQEYLDEADDDFMQWSEGYEQTEHEDYEICTEEGNNVLKHSGEIQDLLDKVEEFLLNGRV